MNLFLENIGQYLKNHNHGLVSIFGGYVVNYNLLSRQVLAWNVKCQLHNHFIVKLA